jgi:TRAP-type C4-dicarboxylate transport system substrate-binding protein
MKHLAIGLVAALLAAAPLAATPATAQTVTLKFGADTASAGSLWTNELKPWAEKVMAESGGSLKFEYYPDGLLSKLGDTFDRTTTGVVDVVWDLPLVYGRRFQSMTVLGVPGLYDVPEDAAAALWRMYDKGQVGQEFADIKMIAFLINPNVGVFTKKPLADPGSLKGVKVSVGSKLRADIVQNLGGVPVSLRVPELYQALSKGVVDGSMTNYGVVQAARLEDQVHWYLDGPMGGAVATLYMSKKVYDGLPAAAKKAIDANTGEATSRWLSRVATQDEKKILDDLLKTSGNTATVLKGDALAKWTAAFEPVVKDWVSSTPNGQTLIDTFKTEIAKK